MTTVSPARRPSRNGSQATSSLEPIVGSTPPVRGRPRRSAAPHRRPGPRAGRRAGRGRVARSVGRAGQRRLDDRRHRVDRRADGEVDQPVRVRRRPRLRRGQQIPGKVSQVGRARGAQRAEAQCAASASRGGWPATKVASLLDLANLGGAAGRTEILEELVVRRWCSRATAPAHRPRRRSPPPGTPARTHHSRRTRQGGCRASGCPHRCSRPGTPRCRPCPAGPHRARR